MKQGHIEGGQGGGRWCVLTTSPSRTVVLSKSLSAASIEAWTPKTILFRRRPRSHQVDELEAPIVPTYVFARAVHVDQLAGLAAPGAVHDHPQFSIFHYGDRIPLVSDAEIVGMQEAERADEIAVRANRQALELERRRAEDKRQRQVRQEKRRAGRRAPRGLRVGQSATIQDSAWAGKTGVIESTDGKTARISFGGSMGVTVDAWLLITDEVRAR